MVDIGPIVNKAALVYVITRCRSGDKPFLVSMKTQFIEDSMHHHAWMW